jgi:hypothetical protein
VGTTSTQYSYYSSRLCMCLTFLNMKYPVHIYHERVVQICRRLSWTLENWAVWAHRYILLQLQLLLPPFKHSSSPTVLLIPPHFLAISLYILTNTFTFYTIPPHLLLIPPHFLAIPLYILTNTPTFYPIPSHLLLIPPHFLAIPLHILTTTPTFYPIPPHTFQPFIYTF